MLGDAALALNREKAAESLDFAAWETNSYEPQLYTDDTTDSDKNLYGLTSAIFSVRFVFYL